MVKAAVERKDAAWKIWRGKNEVAIERCIKFYKEEKRAVKRCIY